MKNKIKKIIIFLVVLLISFNVFATSFYSGNDLKRKVNSTDPFESGFSYGYISAVSDSLYKSRIAGFQMCLPKEVELGQLIDVVKIFLDTHPNLLHFTASSLVAKALQDAYPCSQKNSR